MIIKIFGIAFILALLYPFAISIAASVDDTVVIIVGLLGVFMVCMKLIHMTVKVFVGRNAADAVVADLITGAIKKVGRVAFRTAMSPYVGLQYVMRGIRRLIEEDT